MKLLSKENFDEVKTGNSLIFFYRAEGCGNCKATKPHIESFKKEGVAVYSIDGDFEREITNRYAPAGKWSFPLIVYMEDGEVINTSSGLADGNSLMNLTKTLLNISDKDLMGTKYLTAIKVAEKEKELFDIKYALIEVEDEIIRRQQSITQPQTTPDIDCSDCDTECGEDKECLDECRRYCKHVGIKEDDR